MKLIQTDRELIAKRKCQTKGCNEKSEAIIYTFFYCKACSKKVKEKDFKRVYFDKARVLRLIK